MSAAVSPDTVQAVYEANMALPREGLVAWTSGNASARDPDSGLVVIKPSGVPYEAMTPEQMVVVDLHGNVAGDGLAPSSDTATHLYIYRQRPDINGVIHTHSTYATAWATTGAPIPVYMTSIADNFGGPVPCGGYAPIGGEDIGSEVLRVCGHSPAVLMANHGVFCLAATLRDTLRAAVMVEEAARTALLARLLGDPTELPADEVARQHDFYVHQYGQRR